MSRFLTTLLATAAGSPHGMTTGDARAMARRTWPEIHAAARRGAGALTAAGVGRGSAVGVLAGEVACVVLRQVRHAAMLRAAPTQPGPYQDAELAG